MLCTECLHIGSPENALEGSDRVEAVAWCLFALPGLLYCGWRHATRFKVCSRCGSDALMRESRAAASRHALATPTADDSPSPHRSKGGFAWPHAFGSTRARLRSGAAFCAFIVWGASAGLLGWLDLASAEQASHTATASALLCATWLAHQVHLASRPRGVALRCEAWDANGRALRIERV
jgi:hypothetical protein